jgi:uncharacterized membrane protein YhhN
MRTFLKILFCVTGAALCAVLVLSRLGDWLREVTPPRLHQPLWATGLGFFFASVALLLRFPNRPAAFSERQWVILMGSLAAVGVLLFAFYISGLTCEVRYGSKSARLDCSDAGMPPIRRRD